MTDCARSPTPKAFTDTPSRTWASTLSPSVTPTWRMFSPKRATFSDCASCQAQAARAHELSRAATCGSCQWPTTTLRFSRRRLTMNPNSRSPCADWFRFMKSMSIPDHGISRLNCVCRCASGFWSAVKPAIHIFAGENVCIQAISPTHASAALASRHRRANCFRRGDHGLEDDAHRQGVASVEGLGDLPRVVRHLTERLLAVEVLATRHEPDFELLQVHVRLQWVSGRAAGRSCSR